jgi:hypothetical protein
MASASQISAGRARHSVRAVADPEMRRSEDCPPYHYCNRMRLTACRSVSCYGRFSRPNRVRGEGPVKIGRLRRMNALLLGLESFC